MTPSLTIKVREGKLITITSASSIVFAGGSDGTVSINIIESSRVINCVSSSCHTKRAYDTFTLPQTIVDIPENEWSPYDNLPSGPAVAKLYFRIEQWLMAVNAFEDITDVNFLKH